MPLPLVGVKMDKLPALTVLNFYRLTGTVETFSAAIIALARRVEVEGHPGVLSYRFFLDPDTSTARGIVDYADAEAWIGHHEIAMAWPEMRSLHAAAPLVEATFLGVMTAEISDWLARSGITAKVTSGYCATAGFTRRG